MPHTEPAQLASTLAHLRHDLIKHLDIPRANANMTRAAWQVLGRRLYSEHVGVVSMGQEWLGRLRKLPEAAAFEGALKAVRESIEVLAGLKQDIEKWAAETAKAPASLGKALQGFVNSVKALEAQIKASALQAVAAEDVPDDLDDLDENADDAAALDWILEPTPPPSASSSCGA